MHICEKVYMLLDAICKSNIHRLSLWVTRIDCLWSDEHRHIFAFFVQADQVDDVVHGKEPGIWDSFSWTTCLGRAACWELRSSISIVSIHSLDAWEPLQWFCYTLIDTHSYCECWISALSSLRNTAEMDHIFYTVWHWLYFWVSMDFMLVSCVSRVSVWILFRLSLIFHSPFACQFLLCFWVKTMH